MLTLDKKITVHQLATMLSTSKNVLFPDHNHLLTTGDEDPTLIFIRGPAKEIFKVKGHQQWWLGGGYDLERGQFLEVDSMVLSWRIVAF